MAKPPAQKSMLPQQGMLPQDRAVLEAAVRASYQRYQAAKASGFVDYVLRRGPDLVIRSGTR